MEQKIIDKLSLTETDIQFGQTFVHGIKVYQFNDNLFLTDADTLGEPSKNGNILWFTKDFKHHGKVSSGLLLDLSANEIAENFNHYMRRYIV